MEGRQDNRVLIPPSARAPERPPSDLIWSLAGTSMGTTWSVRLVPPPGVAQDVFQTAVEEELARIIALHTAVAVATIPLIVALAG